MNFSIKKGLKNLLDCTYIDEIEKSLIIEQSLLFIRQILKWRIESYCHEKMINLDCDNDINNILKLIKEELKG